MTKTITHDLDQGSDAWLAFRMKYFGASEAAPMLGLSLNVTRTELLHAKSTGIAKEFSDFVQTPIVRNKHGDSSGVRGAAWLWPAV